MKFRMMLILAVLCLGVAARTWAAPQKAIAVSVKVTTSNGQCISGWNWNPIGAGGFQPVYEKVDIANNTIEVVFYALDWSSHPTQRYFLFEVFPCNGQPSWIMRVYVPATDNDCSHNTFYSDDYIIEGQSFFSRKMELSADPVVCNTVKLSSTCVLQNAIFEASQNPSDPASWRTVHVESGGGSAWNVTTLITDNDLRAAGFSDPYATTYARARDSQALDNPAWAGISYDRSTNVVPFKLFAPPPAVSIINPTEVVCKGQSNGTVTIRISHPVAEIDHFVVNCKNLDTGELIPINDGIVAGDNLVTGLRAGRWEFEVINNVNTSRYGVCSTSRTQTISEPDVVSIRFDVPLFNGYAIRCAGGSNGQATAIGQGGVGGYKDFQWTGGLASDTYTARSAGTYMVSLKDANNCPATSSVILAQPNPLDITLTAPAKYNGYPVSCLNHNDGELNAAVTGGAGGYSYSWTNHGSTTSMAGNLSANLSYTVTVTDGNTCSAVKSMTLNAPLPIDFTLRTLTGITCPGDQTASFDVTGVTNTIGDVAYAWTPSGSGTSITGKGAGTYTITVSDEQGCSTLKSVTLTDPPAYTVSLDPLLQYNGSAIKCTGDYNGELTTTVKDAGGAVATAQNYRWTRNGVPIGENPSLTAMTELNSGVYKVVITYNNQCEAEDTYALLDPLTLRAEIKVDKLVQCHDESNASLKFEATGGTGGPAGYTYRWSTGANTPALTDLPAGGYGIKLWDANGCLARDTVTLVNPGQVEARIVRASEYSGFGVTCAGKNDGFAVAEGAGGTESFTYAWSNGPLTEANNNLVAGDYTVTVTDGHGCSASITHDVTTPAPLSLQVDQNLKKDVRCFGGTDGSIVLLAQGGAGDNKYSKDNARWRQLEKFDTLKMGDYVFYVRDGNGCPAMVSERLTEPSQIEIEFTGVEPAFCSTPVGKATGVVTGGVEDYTYEWRREGEPALLSTNITLSGVLAGKFHLLVTDDHQCVMENTVSITSIDGAKATFTAVDTRCHDSADGSAEISINEGAGPFNIEWPEPGKQTTEQVTGLRGGTYDVEITDARGCLVILPVTVLSPAPLELGINTEKLPTCNTSCDGELTLEAKGGVGNYSYAWNGQTAAAQTQLCAARYVVVVSDGNSCVLSTEVELGQPEPIRVVVTREVMATCRDGCDGQLEVGAEGGNGGYQYTWAAGGDTPLKDNLCPGAYRVSVIDSKGCTGQGTVTLNNTAPLPLDLGGGVTLCVGQSHLLDAGPGWTQTSWGSSTGFTSGLQQVTIKDPGSYWVDVLSDKGCVARDTFLLETSFDLLKASFMIAQEAVVGDTVVMIDISWPLPESIAWDFPLVMKEVLNLGDAVFGQFAEPGTYEVGLTAHLGECVDQVTKTITILGDEGDSSDGKLGYDAFVKSFKLFPNPNDGSFEVGIELAEASTVTVSVWSSETGVLLGKLRNEGAASYKLFFDLRPLSSGTYVLRLDHEHGKAYIRFIVH